MNPGARSFGIATLSRRLCGCSVVGFMWCAGLAGAEPVSPSPREGSTAPSPAVSAAVTAKLPKFSPPPAEPAPDSNPAANEAATTGGDILKLDKVVVRRRPDANAPEDAWLSKRGRDDLALKQNPGLRVGNVFGLNQGIASEMRREEQEAKKRAALADEVKRSGVSKNKADRKLRRLMQDAVARPNTEWLNGR